MRVKFQHRLNVRRGPGDSVRVAGTARGLRSAFLRIDPPSPLAQPPPRRAESPPAQARQAAPRSALPAAGLFLFPGGGPFLFAIVNRGSDGGWVDPTGASVSGTKKTGHQTHGRRTTCAN